MPLLFSQLVSPLNQPTWLQFLLNSLQGVGPVIQSPAINTNQLVGTGTISVQGPVLAASQVVIKITTTGNAAASNPAFFQYSLDGGLTFNPVSPVSLASAAMGPGFTYSIPTVNVTIAFANGAYTTSTSGGFSFFAGETYAFQCNIPTFPVTNWPAIGVGNALLQVDSQALADLNLVVAQSIAGGFTQSWINPPLINGVPTTPPDGWLDLLAQSFYNRTRAAALQTQGIAVLTALSTAGPYTISAGQLFAANGGGQFIFTNITGGTLPHGGTLALVFQAVNPGAAANQVTSFNGVLATASNLTQLLTPLAGVSILNPLQTAPTVTHSGTGSGTVSALAGGGGPSGDYQILIKILQSGGLGTGTFQYSTNGGTTYSAQATIPSGGTFLVGATNVTITFSGTFVAADLYAFATSWITQRGVDQQSSLSLAVACQNQWASLAPAAPAAQYVIWAQAASPEVVTAFVIPDPVTPGQVDVTLIGANNGPVSSAAITAVQNYLLPRIPIGITPTTGTVSQLSVTVAAAYIIVHGAYRSTVIAAIQQLLNAYANTILPQGSVDLSVVAELIQQAPGVIEINPLSSLTLNGLAADIQLTANQTVVFVAPTSASFRFV